MTHPPQVQSQDAQSQVLVSGARAAEAANEARILAVLVSGSDDAEGLIAFALHRQAAMEWQAVFEASRKTRPTPDDYALFMLGEEMPGRIASYRERAALLLASQAAEMADAALPSGNPLPSGKNAQSEKPMRFRSIFWPWGLASGFRADLADQPVNWRGLLIRLLILGGAVVVTALFFRFFVPKG